MAQQTKRRSDRKKSKSRSRSKSHSRRSNSGSSKPVQQRQTGSDRNKSPTPQKEEQGSDGQREAEIRNQGKDQTVPERMYQDYTVIDPGEISDTDEPDVVVDVPIVKVDEIHFELDDLEARVSLYAKVLDLVELSVGVHAELGKVELHIAGVEAQALLRARLDHVTAIIDRVLTTLDRNPDLLKSIGHSLEEVGKGAGEGVGQIGKGAGSAVEDVGEGAEGAVKDVGKGAGSAVEDVGEGAGEGVGQIGKGAGGAVEDVGKGAGEGVGQIGKGAGQAVGGLGEGAGQAVGGLGQGAGGALGGLGGLGQLAGGGGGGGNGGGDGGGNGGGGLTGGRIAKEVAKLVAREIGSAASDEVKDLGIAAGHKAVELGERRRQRRADKRNATEAALREAEQAGIDLDDVEGSGAEGRITVRDVKEAIRE
jgi:hypothetical protein